MATKLKVPLFRKKLADSGALPPKLFNYTLLRGQHDSRLAKALRKDSSGCLIKDSAPLFGSGTAEEKSISSLEELKTAIEGLKVNEAISLGGFNQPLCEIVTKSQLTPEKEQAGVRSRSKEHMKEFDQGLLLLDHDPSRYQPKDLQCDSAAELVDQLTEAIPEFGNKGYLGVDSSSAGIIDSVTGKIFKQGGGFHVYLFIIAILLDEFRRFIEVKLWNADKGFIAFGRNGAMFPRTILDLAVFSPERLIYEARPVLGEDIEKRPRQWDYKPGPPLTLDLTITGAQERECDEKIQAAKQSPEAIETSAKLKKEYLNGKAKELAKHTPISLAVAKERINLQEEQRIRQGKNILGPNDLLEINGQLITVSELLSRGVELDGTVMPDPIEGSAYGMTTAKFYNNDGTRPCINSNAHGGVIYYLLHREPPAIPVQGVSKKTDSTLTFKTMGDEYIEYLKTIQPLDPSGFPNVKTKRNGDIVPIMTIANVDHLLRGYEITIQYNTINKVVIIIIPGLTSSLENFANAAVNHIVSLANLNSLKGIQLLDFVNTLADNYQVNPVGSWIGSIGWDKVNRLPDICNTLHVSDDYPESLRNTLVHTFLLSAVAAATKASGFSARGVLVLKGPQAIGKTSWIKALVSLPLLQDKVVLLGHHLDAADKDSRLTAITHWIVELGELDSSFKKDIARIKGFITNSHDKIRRPYARGDSEYQRRTVFCASVNDDNFLVDDTGNSRWWTISVTAIEYQHQIDMQQVYAQLAEELENGAQWWLSKDDEKLLEIQNKNYRSVSTLRERLLEAMDMDLPMAKHQTLSASQTLQEIGIRNPSNHQCRECGGILREYFGEPKKIRGILKWRVPLISYQFKPYLDR
jgi:hypothetical protein